MDLYLFCLLLGGAGLLAMAALGAGHVGGHGNSHGGSHAGSANGHGGHAGHDTAVTHAGPLGHGAGARGHGLRGGRGRGATGSTLRSLVLSLLSPIVLFSVLLGFGGAGWLLRGMLGGVALFGAALVGGLLFESVLVRPVWNFLFRFASKPAETLEGQLASSATASSGFDAEGHGLVAIEVNGEIVQCLGTLRDDDRALGIRVHAGDQLRVEAVDAARNQCTVSYVGPAGLAG